jgi:uncharacterized protein YegP (UPF0339 family)
MHFSLYKDAANQWRWTLYAANEKKIADSGEAYHNKQDAIHGIDLVKGTNAATPVREAWFDTVNISLTATSRSESPAYLLGFFFFDFILGFGGNLCAEENAKLELSG